MNSIKISVIIVTKNRKQILQSCLNSLLDQTSLPDELIIIDNNSTDGSREMIQTIQRTAKFPIHCFKEPREGYPIIYNRGIKEAHFPWVVCIDSDCIADPDWVFEIKRAIRSNRTAAAILGYSATAYPQNIYSLCTHYTIEFWKNQGRQGKKIINFEILDNKNIVYNKQFLKKHALAYTEELCAVFYGACEDCDLGMQIQQAGGSAIYENRIKVTHLDPTTLGVYIRKLTNSTFSYMNFERNWKNYRSTVQKKHKTQHRINALPFARHYRLSIGGMISFMFLLYGTYIYTKILRLSRYTR